MWGQPLKSLACAFRSKGISTYSFMVDILSPGCRPMSGNVGGAISRSGVVENVGVAVEG